MKTKTIPNMNVPMNGSVKTSNAQSKTILTKPMSVAEMKAQATNKKPKMPVKKLQPIQKQQASNNASQQTGTILDDAIFTKLIDLMSPYGNMDKDVFMKNVALSTGDGMSMADRTISIDIVNYLMKNAAFVTSGLVMSSEFRDAFVDAVSTEMVLDSKDEKTIAETRKKMKDGTSSEPTGTITIGVTQFMPQISDFYAKEMADGFQSMIPYDDEFEKEAKALTNDDRTKIGLVLSNFMYLIRAFAKNEAFMTYIVTVCESVKESIAE